MATAPDEEKPDWQIAAEAKLRRKKHRAETKKSAGQEISMWTVNTGGLAGTWRVVHLFDSLEEQDRPSVLCMQECSCTDEQWLGIQRVMNRHGYRGFHTGGRKMGQSNASYQWHRGILTFVDDKLEANWIGQCSWEGGQFHGVAVDSVLVLNYYVAPRSEYLTGQVCRCQDFWEQTGWKGRWVMLGDFNEEWESSWIGTLATLLGGWQPNANFQSTRWNGSRAIDYMVANFDLSEMQARSEKLSDHKIVQCKFEHKHKVDSNQWRFKVKPNFTCPLWLTQSRWNELFDEAFLHGQETDWEESCQMVENYQNWDELSDEEGSAAVDMEWCMVCAQISWAYNVAYRFSICEIPEGYDNDAEMRRVVHMINHRFIKGMECGIAKRSFPRKPKFKNEMIRRRQVRIGRLHELCTRLRLSKCDKETKNLCKKLYGGDRCDDISIRSVAQELRIEEERQRKDEEKCMTDALSKWKTDMRHNIKRKSSWINKKGSKLSPSVQTTGGVTATKMQAAEALFHYWENLWQKQQWNEEEKDSKISRMVQVLRDGFETEHIPDGRPTLQAFQERLGAISGCAGIDGWNAEELSTIASSGRASRTVWSAMARWELFTSIPTALRNCKLVHIPKKEARILQAGQFRPIAIMSAFWRAWSSTWMRSEWVRGWSKRLFPPNVTGGMPGAQGPEAMASILAHELSKKKHGITMDFKHAFDTVDVTVMQSVFDELLPSSTARWHSLLFEQWKTMQRWVVIDSGVHPQSLQVTQGLPQGDPGSCIVMATLMLALKKMVDSDVQQQGHNVYHSIYMDDRTAIASTEEEIDAVQERWLHYATQYHLMENQDKAQKVNLNVSGSAFEVLGTVVGNFQEEKQKDSKLFKRVDSVGSLYRKIGILPTTVNGKVKDIGVYGRGKLSYGWVSTRPYADWIKEQEQQMWKAVGKLTYANPHMRRVVGGANTSLKMVAFMRQLRLLSQRNAKLEEQGIEVVQCQLDKFVASTLRELNWTHIDGKYVHDLYSEGFEINDLIDDNSWRKVGHYVRESYRALHYELYGLSGRHELSGHDFPPYNPKRRELACKWAANDGLAWLLIQGAVQSPQVRLRSSHVESRCIECGYHNPTWDHLWKCFTGEDAPEDVLMKRHLWPRDAKDLLLCQKFIDGLRRFNDGQ